MVKVSPSPPLVWCAKCLRSFINGMPTVHHVQLQKLIAPLTLPCENAVGKTSRFQTEMRLQSLSDRSCRVISFEESGRRLAAQCQQRWWCRNGDALTDIIGDHGGRFNPLIPTPKASHTTLHTITHSVLHGGASLHCFLLVHLQTSSSYGAHEYCRTNLG